MPQNVSCREGMLCLVVPLLCLFYKSYRSSWSSLHRNVYEIDIQSQVIRDYINMGFVMFHSNAILFCRWSVKCTGQRTIMNLNSTEILLWRLSPTQPSTFMTLESLKLNWSVLYYLHIESSDINLTKKVLIKDIISIRLFVYM